MESMEATSADRSATIAAPATVTRNLYRRSAAAGGRSAELRRLLASADVGAGALAGLRGTLPPASAAMVTGTAAFFAVASAWLLQS